MLQPVFSITNEILTNIGLIEAAKEVIENAPLIPIYESRFKKDALARTVHHATHIEGNDLTLNEVRKIMDGEVFTARERDVQEVINYRDVLKYVGSLKREMGSRNYYSGKMIQKINKIACEKIIIDGRAGRYRDTQVVLKNSRTGEVVFRPPAAIEVSYLMEDFFDWLNSSPARKIHPVLRAGIAHYFLVSIHPFIEANGRSSRAFTTLILFVEGHDIKKFFSLEDYFDKDAGRYYQAMMEVDKLDEDIFKRDLTSWLNYFTQATASELTRVKEKVKDLSVDIKIKGRIGKQIPLNERQIKLMEYLEENGSISTSEARKVVSGYSDDTIVRDFNYFKKQGIIKKVGKTKASRYIITQGELSRPAKRRNIMNQK